MAVSPKKFEAAAAFQYRGRSYTVGDPITDRRTIAHLVRYGDRFARRASKPASAETSAEPPVDTATHESTKED